MSKTVRDLTAEPIPADVLERIIAAGIQAPTYDHRRDPAWGRRKKKRFTVCQSICRSTGRKPFCKCFGFPATENVCGRNAETVFHASE